MQIIIEISSYDKEWITNGYYIPEEINMRISEAIANGIPFPEICDRGKSEIKNEVKDLSKRVETLEKQLKEDKEEQLKKLKAELEYAKFRCALPVIQGDMNVR